MIVIREKSIGYSGVPPPRLWLSTCPGLLRLKRSQISIGYPYSPVVNTIWWGVALGILMISLLGRVPREFVMSALGTATGIRGVMRATLAGVMLDLCSHGILMVGAKLYERGASIGQVIAFLVASPWNSFSLTLVLFAFIFASMVIAVIAGTLFDLLVRRGVLPKNQATNDLPADFDLFAEAKKGWADLELTRGWVFDTLREGLMESRMVMRWILFGVLLAGVVRALVPDDAFSTYFGPTLMGLGLTVVAATILEVCSEGSTPIAADLLTRANAPGNSFAFLMTGVSTDYTEIMILKDTTSSWKIPLFLPLLTVPQVLTVALCINYFVQ